MTNNAKPTGLQTDMQEAEQSFESFLTPEEQPENETEQASEDVVNEEEVIEDEVIEDAVWWLRASRRDDTIHSRCGGQCLRCLHGLWNSACRHRGRGGYDIQG